ncbi:MAG: hypothetical protein AB1758_30625, partial [Candidatus Eremiobacterota bacterium]
MADSVPLLSFNTAPPPRQRSVVPGVPTDPRETFTSGGGALPRPLLPLTEAPRPEVSSDRAKWFTIGVAATLVLVGGAAVF